MRIASMVQVTVLVASAVVAAARKALVVARVHGASMTPTYADGDRLLALRRRYFRPLRVGDVVVCALPPDRSLLTPLESDPLIVKRVAAVAGEPVPDSPHADVVPVGRVYVLGDALRHSMDSRELGALPVELVVGVVVGRLTGQSR